MKLGQFVRAEPISEKRKEMLSAYYGVIPRLMTVPAGLFPTGGSEKRSLFGPGLLWHVHQYYGIGHGMILARPGIVDSPDGCWPDMKIMKVIRKHNMIGTHQT